MASVTALSSSTFAGKAVAQKAQRRATKVCMVTKASADKADLSVSRRAALALTAGAAALVAKAPASEAAYGESANVFGGITNDSGASPPHSHLSLQHSVSINCERPKSLGGSGSPGHFGCPGALLRGKRRRS